MSLEGSLQDFQSIPGRTCEFDEDHGLALFSVSHDGYCGVYFDAVCGGCFLDWFAGADPDDPTYQTQRGKTRTVETVQAYRGNDDGTERWVALPFRDALAIARARKDAG